MAKAKTKKAVKRPVGDAWSEIAKDEAAFIGVATKAVERVPAPADMLDGALAFTAKTLKSQKEALVSLLDGVSPKSRAGSKAMSPAATAVKAAFELAERVVQTQRRLLPRLVETVTPPLARHAPKARVAARATHAAPHKRVHRAPKTAS